MKQETGEEKVETAEVGGEEGGERVKEVREIVVPAVSVYQASQMIEKLSACIRMMKHGRWNGVDPASISIPSLAGEVENGKTLEEAIGEIERKVLLTLVERHETSKALAVVLKKGEGAVRTLLMRRGISLREPT